MGQGSPALCAQLEGAEGCKKGNYTKDVLELMKLTINLSSKTDQICDNQQTKVIMLN